MAATFDIGLISSIGHQTATNPRPLTSRFVVAGARRIPRTCAGAARKKPTGNLLISWVKYGKAWINGFQGQGMIAIPSTLPAMVRPRVGATGQDIGLSDRVMREIHLPRFRTAIEEAHAGMARV